MNRKIIHFCLLAALAGASAWALADPPAVVGRISSVQGQVTLVGDDEPVAVSLNWPVTADNHINTATGGRTEFRVGSTAVRVDGDSDLEITGMDDDLLRLRLNYGSVSIHIRSPELLRDFELTTPQARITMIEPGVLRVDADRVADTSQISVLAGTARVDGAGSSVTVNTGRHVDVTSEDVRTNVARRDGFDIWAEERDRQDQTATATRFVSSGMTGYEELDRNGSWSEDAEYGTLWTPRNVAADWAPYRDGRWIWLAPWGWTWVDNAPWGYAPSHYGRWVMVNRRWGWAPGRPAGRPVWAPALVGWVGGDGFAHNNHGPGLGWFPLSPRERFVPGYRVSSDYERRMTWTHNGKPFTPRGNDRDERRDGLTVLPRSQFEGRRSVQVNRGQPFIPTGNQVRNVAPVAPPQPSAPGRVLGTNRDRDGDGRPDRFERNDRNDRNDRPGRVITAPSQPVTVSAQPPGRQQPLTTLAPGQFGGRDAPAQTINPNDVRVDVRPRFNPQQNQPTGTAPSLQVSPNGRDRDRFDRNDDDNRRRQRPQQEPRPLQAQPQPMQQPQQLPQPQPVIQPQQPRQFTAPTPQPQPGRQVAAPAQPAPAPTPAAQPAPRENRDAGQRRESERRHNGGDSNRRENLQ
ncbi:FecR domain-containing protein [Duganella aceris]|uniref:FecR domain-containing protein n=1 Tax=Duganella aceris TaxID=2703883 RepID=A0ABX0FFL6_9BURK|nr:FecR domain-containing protein [Duganella aceris]NGZ83324.1 FecR domain-containing protein [Duganella aceris]